MLSGIDSTKMTLEQAKQRMRDFMGDLEVLTFSVKHFPGPEYKWVAQCNEIDGIITCGTGFDQDKMEELMEDAIISAARIPKKYSNGLLKKVWNPGITACTNIDLNSSVKLFQSTYQPVS